MHGRSGWEEGRGEGRLGLVSDEAEFCILITLLAGCFYFVWSFDKGAKGVALVYLVNSKAEKEYSRLDVRT